MIYSSPNFAIYLYASDTAVIISADNDLELHYCINDLLTTYNTWCNLNYTVVNHGKSSFYLSILIMFLFL